MIFLKTFNNSAALVKDDDGKEEIVLGKGVGFGLKKGQEIDESKIERRFVTTENSNEVKQVKEFRPQTIDITNKVIEMVEPLLQTKFTDYQFLALADHIDFAVTRINDNIDIDPANNEWEVKNLFPKEYAVAAKVITLINAELGIKLPKSETTFMTYHLVNAASDDAQVQETMQITKLISGIINIIQFQYQITIDTTSFSYSRFITHLRILLVRLLRKDKKKNPQLDPSLLSFTKIKYNKAYETAERIATYLHSKMGWTLDSDDKFYLVLHIFRVTSRQ
ncbi:PRD domain-containing protein [Lactobacillus kefiranofaciens]|uniref:PRD domain-containing protein n=1 Tax=Lactobacillus kefiranofaciens TaxID=267818 RepID=A0AAX3UES4_9LACO|nr:PRD domain-containing protein [Lactobacillus kefiranofaciens]AEG40628.1 Transcription antiterminator [Lactobacillus kefiranofaciens subsp. kefiranofaciens]KRM22635.1 transcription antiterminator [Lactobacillus kefiranofaciens subsp. kefiranofaciens DSM 5016 = JCM 6985]QFQ68146.1 PRD domain-containing protein [Lactobacillus kefiranofaciens subsp. kefiranofaciens]WGO86068.1 PRD domain-containing protein [Lactobacillus kefiranofaciens]WQH36613.1 PRD domain-containing protein [Lactobacillus kef